MDAIEEDESIGKNLITDVPLDVEAIAPKQEADPPLLPIKEKMETPIDWMPPETGVFAGPLHSIVDPVAMRRTILITEIEALRTRVATVEELSFQLQTQIETKQNEIHQLNDYLSACALVAEQGRMIESLLETIQPIKASTSHFHLSSGPNCYTSRDCLRTFEEDPTISLSTSEVIARAPLAKRADAKKRISMRIGYLFQVGKLERIFAGVYRLAAQPADQSAEEIVLKKTEEPVKTPPKSEKVVIVKPTKQEISKPKKAEKTKTTQPGKKRKLNNGTGNNAMPAVPRGIPEAVSGRKHYARHSVTPR